jgi:hypothetical protein
MPEFTGQRDPVSHNCETRRGQPFHVVHERRPTVTSTCSKSADPVKDAAVGLRRSSDGLLPTASGIASQSSGGL